MTSIRVLVCAEGASDVAWLLAVLRAHGFRKEGAYELWHDAPEPKLGFRSPRYVRNANVVAQLVDAEGFGNLVRAAQSALNLTKEPPTTIGFVADRDDCSTEERKKRLRDALETATRSGALRLGSLAPHVCVVPPDELGEAIEATILGWLRQRDGRLADLASRFLRSASEAPSPLRSSEPLSTSRQRHKAELAVSFARLAPGAGLTGTIERLDWFDSAKAAETADPFVHDFLRRLRLFS